MTASTIGSPTLPQATELSPAVRRIVSSICTVVVLPLVPVTQSQVPGCSGSRSRQASSTSPHTGTARAVAATISGAVGGTPGEVTTTSTSSGRVAVSPSPIRTVAPSTSSRCAFSRCLSLADSARTVTLAPRCSRLSAAAKPETPMPTTTARTPTQSLLRVRVSGLMPGPRGSSSYAGDPLGVEDAEARCDADAGDDPEPDHDRDLRPA